MTPTRTTDRLARLVPLAALALGALLRAAPASADVAGACDSPPCSRTELESYERRVVKHLLHAQQARFEADARGERKVVKHYDREFQRAQQRRAEARRALENAR